MGSRELLLVMARDEGRATEAEMWRLTPGRRNSVRPLALEVGASPSGGGWSAGEPRPGGRRRRASAREVAALGGWASVGEVFGRSRGGSAAGERAAAVRRGRRLVGVTADPG